MAVVETFRIALTPEFAGLVREAVASGEYASESDVIRDALSSWKAARGPHELDAQAVRRLWQEGIESGPGRFADLDAIKREARRRLTESTPPGRSPAG